MSRCHASLKGLKNNKIKVSLRARSVLGAKNEEKNPELKKLDFWVIIAKGLAPNEQKCIHASSAENIIEIDESPIQ